MIQFLKEDEAFSKQIVHWHTIEEKEAEYRDFPERLDENIVRALKKRGIEKLYSHQAEAFQGSTSGQNVTLVTPTASGKTLCYNLPVLQRITEDPDARALYLFPTKALSQDQKSELNELIDEIGASIAIHMTAIHHRRSGRKSEKPAIS